jgi:transcriptional regulator with XRE-family HTH domain
VADDRPGAAEVAVNLGARLRTVRQQSGLSLREVARQLGVSPSFVSQLETGKSQPSVATLYSLAQLLGFSIDQIFSVDGSVVEQVALPATAAISRSELGSPADAWPQGHGRARLAVMRRGDRPQLVMDSGVIWVQLASNTGSDLDFIEVIYPPHSSSTNDNRMLQHAGFEYGYLIEGELEMTVGFEVFTLRAGESMGFDSAIPHLFRNLGSEPARGVWCVRHPRGYQVQSDEMDNLTPDSHAFTIAERPTLAAAPSVGRRGPGAGRRPPTDEVAHEGPSVRRERAPRGQ